MKIAFVVMELGLGGAEHVAQILADRYIDRGNDVIFFLVLNHAAVFFKTKADIITLGLSYDDLMKPERMIRSSLLLKKYKRKYRPDVAVSFEEACNSLNILSKGHEQVILSIRTLLSLRKDLMGPVYMEKSWIRHLYGKAEKVVAVSDAVNDDLNTNYGIEKQKIVTIPNASIKQKVNLDKEWEYGEKAVVCAGRFNPVKQMDRILRSFSSVIKDEKEARLIVLGEGFLERYLKAYCRFLGLEDSVVFTGLVKDVGYYLFHARAFVMASTAEGFPNAMIEAMTYGVPVITMDSPGGCREILGNTEEEFDGLQFCRYGIKSPYISGKPRFSSPLTEEEMILAKGISDILKNDAVYEKYSARSLERAQYYDEENVFAKWDELVEKHR